MFSQYLTSSDRARGFTLLELMVVMVIMVLLAGVVAINLGASLEDSRLRAGARAVTALFRYARSHAVTYHADVQVVFDLPQRGMMAQVPETGEEGGTQWRPLTTPAGRPRALPDGVEITDVRQGGSPETEGAETATVTFSSLGQADDTMLTLRNARGRTLIILLDGVTGRCEVTDEAP